MIQRRNLSRIFKKVSGQGGYALRAFQQRFLSFLSYHLRDGWSSPPETLSLFLTYRCNLSCVMCGQWGETGAYVNLERKGLRAELSLEEIIRLVDEVSSFKPNITLFGGEPTLYQDWLKVVAEIKRRGMRCNMVTNGTLIGKYAKEIVNSRLDEIILSLNGVGEVHDRITRVKGTFSRVCNGIATLNAIKERQRAKYPLVNINCTISETNYQTLEDIANVAEKLRVTSLTFHHLLFLSEKAYTEHNRIFQQRFKHVCHDWAGFVSKELPKIDVDELLENIEKVKKVKDRKVRISFYPNFTDEEIREYYTKGEFTPRSYKNRCMALWMVSYIFPDGSVRPYHTMDYPMGNITESRFADIWNGKRYRSYRKVVKEIKTFPVCSKGCTELYRY